MGVSIVYTPQSKVWLRGTDIHFTARGRDVHKDWSEAKIVWTSGAGMVDSTRYVRTNNEDELPKIVNLAEAGKLYYMMIWTGAPGNTPGYIKVKGRKMG